jgi:hypothetical protein
VGSDGSTPKLPHEAQSALGSLRGDIPAFASLNEADRHEVKALDRDPRVCGQLRIRDGSAGRFSNFERLARFDAAQKPGS